MHRKLIFGLISILLLSGCTSEPEDDCFGSNSDKAPYIGEPMFDRCEGFDVKVNRTNFTVGDTLTISMSFSPLFSGRGRLTVWFLPLASNTGHKGIVIASPEVEHIAGETYFTSVVIDCSGRCQIPLTFVVRDPTPYHISASVRFEEVYDGASDQMYHVGSEEQIEALGKLDHTGYSSSTLELPKPQLDKVGLFR